MRFVRLIAILLVSLVLAGCPAMNPRYLARPLVIDATGPFIHAVSGMTFPTAVGDFQREAIYQYDEQGLDVSVGYNLFKPPSPVSTTVYIYPSPSITSVGSPEEVVATARANLAARVYEAEKQQITQAHGGAKLIEEKEITLQQTDSTYSGMQATFEYDEISAGRSQSVRSHLLLFCYVGSKWIIKYRITHLKGFDASRQIDQFLRELRWTFNDS